MAASEACDGARQRISSAEACAPPFRCEEHRLRRSGARAPRRAHFRDGAAGTGPARQLAARITVLPFGVGVIEAVAAGRFELGISQSSEIVQHAGVRYGRCRRRTVSPRYRAAALKGRTNGAALLRYLAGPADRQQAARVALRHPD